VKNLAIARRYAKALLLIAKEDGNTESYRQELDKFANLVESEKSLEQAIVNPLYDTGDRKKVLQTVVDRLNLSRVIKSFLILLFEKGRIGFISSINEFYQKLADELKGVARASLLSAATLPPETIDKICLALSKKTGRDIILNVETDPALIGGIITRIGDLVLDGSLKTQLFNMRESLKRGESV